LGGSKGKEFSNSEVNTWVGGKDVSKGDGSSTRTSNTLEENPSFHEEVNEVCSQTELHYTVQRGS
jgi:hypothetical protein